MDLVSGYKGVVGLVFGNDNFGASEDSYVERLLDRIGNGVLAEDRRSAIAELQSVVGETRAAQLAFGAMGFPVLLGVLKEDKEDVEMVRGALETLVSALTPIDHVKGSPNEIQPAKMNADLLSREPESISLLLSLLAEDDFYVRYYTLQLLTALLTSSLNRLQEAILSIPRGITRLVDMLMDREVIRNEALLLLTYLTREAEEIQKILVFEGVFEKIFSILKEEGGSDGGVVVQDCFELLNNLLHKNPSNQILLRETIGFDPLVSILKLRASTYSFTKQKALQCIGDLISEHSKNRDALASKVLGEETQLEPCLNSILRIILRTSSMQEFLAADYIFKCFCEGNRDGQTMLASTLIPQPLAVIHSALEEDVHMSFGSMLLRGLTLSENESDLETCCRAASVLSHILKDNLQCKERAIRIEVDAPALSLGGPEPLMYRTVKHLALASPKNVSSSPSNNFVQPIILKLLVIWLADCPSAVECFLNSRPHLTYLLELVSNPSATVCTRGMAAILLGECVLYNKSNETGKDSFGIVDFISQKLGITAYLLKFEEMQKSYTFLSIKSKQQRKPLTRSTASSMSEIDEGDGSELKNEDHPSLAIVFDAPFVNFLKSLEDAVRERIVDLYSQTKRQVAVMPAELEQKSGESDKEYIERLRLFVEKQSFEMRGLLGCNITLAEELTKSSIVNGSPSRPDRMSITVSDRVQLDTLTRDLQEAHLRLDHLKAEKTKLESKASNYQSLTEKTETDLKSLSDAYNSLEEANFSLEREIKALRSGGSGPDLEAVKAEAREEVEVELNDLLVCLGQEQSKVEKLSARLVELGEDVDQLLEGIGEETEIIDEEDDEEE